MTAGTTSIYGVQPARRLTSVRVAAAAAAVALTAGLLAILALSEPIYQRSPEFVRASLILIPPETVEIEIPEAAPEPARRPAITVPDRPVQQPDDRPQTWITPTPAIPGPPEAPAGLRGLMAKDPCLDPMERLRRPDCPPEFDRKALASAGAQAVEERHDREQFLAFAERQNCSGNHGCLDDIDLTRRPPAAKSATSSLGGMNDTVGRLPPPNWYHVDPGFGD